MKTIVKDAGRTMYFTEDGYVRHEFLMGKSGQGKTEYLLSRCAQAIGRGGGLMFVDPKPTKKTRAILQKLCAAYGRPYDFRVLDIGDPANSHTMNFMLEGDASEVLSHVSAIFSSGAAGMTDNAEHFKQQLLMPAGNRIACIKAMNKAFNAMDLYILLSNPAATDWLIRQTPDGSEAKSSLQIEKDGYVITKGDKAEFNQGRWQSQVSGGANRIFPYGSGKLGQVLNTYSPQWTMDDAIDNNRVTYVPLPTLAMPEQSYAFAKMLLSLLKTKVARIYNSDLPDRVFLNIWDEFGSVAMPGTEELIEKKRGARIAGIYSFQTYANLIEVGEPFAARLIGNCELRTAMGLGDADSREFFSTLVGEQLKEFHSRSQSHGKSQSNTDVDFALFSRVGETEGAGSSAAERFDFAIRPEELRDLPIGTAFCAPMASAHAFKVKYPVVTPPEIEDMPLPPVHTTPVAGLNLRAMFTESFQQAA